MSDIVVVNDYCHIPPIFYPEGSDKPFSHCKLCGKELLESETPYLIEKIFKQDVKTGKRKVICEFAYCLECIDSMREELSKDSLGKIEAYFQQNAQVEKRSAGLRANKLFDVDLWLNNCIINNKSIDEIEEFQIYAHCQGKDMLFYQYPYMISGEALDEVANLLSDKTLDFLNNFWLDNVDLPPEMADLFKTRRPVIF